MKPFEIALFKHFIESKGMVTVYVNMYRKRHLKTNPISIEEFLSQVEAKDVCVKAFYFVSNSNYGFDYWTRMQDYWIEFYNENKDNYTSNEWYKLQGMSKILRTNWDAAKHWRQESRIIAAKRLGIELSLLGLDDADKTEKPTKMSEEYLREKYLQEMKSGIKPSTTILQKQNTEQERLDVKTYIKGKEEEDTSSIGGVLGEFEFLDLNNSKDFSRKRLSDNEVSVNTRGIKSRLTFNQKISREIKTRGGYEYVALLKNKKGEVALILNDEKGVTLQDGSTRENSNVIINSKVLVGKVVTFLNIKGDYEVINITEIEKTKDYVVYILTKKN